MTIAALSARLSRLLAALRGWHRPALTPSPESISTPLGLLSQRGIEDGIAQARRTRRYYGRIIR